MAAGAALSILLGLCLRCCLSEKEAASGGAGGGSAGADKEKATYESSPFLITQARNQAAAMNAFKDARDKKLASSNNPFVANLPQNLESPNLFPTDDDVKATVASMVKKK